MKINLASASPAIPTSTNLYHSAPHSESIEVNLTYEIDTLISGTSYDGNLNINSERSKKFRNNQKRKRQNQNGSLKTNEHNNRKMKIVHWNCNSIKSKMKFLEQYIFENKTDIISLNELKCDLELWNHIYNINGYKKIEKCRNNSGGGVCLLIKNDIEFEIVNLDLDLEIVCIKIQSKIGEVYIISWYVPEQNLKKETIEQVIKDKKNLLLMGDLNARTKQFNESTNNNGDELDEFMLNNNLVYINNNKNFTYYKYNNVTKTETKSVLDYFITNIEIGERSINYQTLNFEILDSDHIPIYMEIIIDRTVKVVAKTKQRNYKKTNWQEFRNENDKNEIITNECMSKEETDFKIGELEQNINTAIEKVTPIIKRIIDKQPLTEDILKMIKIKKGLMRTYYNNRKTNEEDLILKNLYYEVKNHIKKEIIEFKNKEWQKELSSYNGQPMSAKKFWDKINKIRGLKGKSSISTLKMDNRIHKTDKEKTEVFRKRLEGIFNETNNKNFNDEHKKEITVAVQRFKDTALILNPTKISEGEFNKAVMEITGKFTEDEFKLSNGVIKQLSDKYKKNLLDIYNSLLKINYIPEKWKVAKVSMLPKTSNDSSNPKNYRPISITPSLIRLYEKIINNRIKKWLKTNNIIIKQQSGFRQNRQTKDNLLFLIEKINESMNRNRKSISIYFDIAAAFDKVWHNGLIYKLIKIKMETYLIKWIIEFLTNRKFYVVIEECKSVKTNISCGVPQGAINSPVLFSIYINDVPTNCKKNSRYSLLFADDLAKLYIFRKVCTTKTIEKEINIDLKKLEEWCSKWRLEIATAKCMFLQHEIKNTQDRFKIGNVHLTMYGNKIEREKETKFLGIKIDESLKFTSHIKKIEASCLNRINIIKVISHKSWKLTNKTLVNIYKCLIRSVMEYSCILLPLIRKDLVKKLKVIQNNCMRIIEKINLLDRVRIVELEQKCNLEDIEVRLNRLRLRYIYKSIYLNNPLIEELKDDYFNYIGGRNIKHKTLLEDVKNWDELEIE
jgi:hypothetical protein